MSFEIPPEGPPGSLNTSPTEPTINYILDHIFFLPKLLQPRYSHEEELQARSYILKALKSSIEAYAQKLPVGKRLCWERIGSMIERMKDLYTYDDFLVSKRIQENLRKLSEGESLALLLRRQNAGMLIRVEIDKAIFEIFEVTPGAKAVLTSSSRLCRSFPGPMYSVPMNVFQSSSFQKELAIYLAAMDGEHYPRTCEEANGGASDPGNISPMMVVEGLGGILHAVGEPYENGIRISKRIGDDCIHQDGAIWRRSPFWLVLRVAIQTTVVRQYSTASPEKARREYKSFMAYFLCRLLKSLPSEVNSPEALHFMVVKLARRFHKMGPELPDFVAKILSKTTSSTAERLTDKWNSSIRRDVRKVEWLPGTVAISEDCNLQFKRFKPYIQTAMHRRQPSHEFITPFQPNHPRRFGDTLGDLERTLGSSEVRTSLNDIEQWVASELNDWMIRHSGNEQEKEQACIELASFMDEYFHKAIKVYQNNPEDMSHAHLTALEIWIALDTLAIQICPFFKDYHPEVDLKFFGNILLPRRSELSRLNEAERYLQARLDRRKNFPRILSDKYSNENCFGVRYFDGSRHLQRKEREIIKEATDGRKQRRLELKDMNKLWEDRMEQASRMPCSRKSASGGTKRHVATECDRCKLESECRKMNITKHEWPLPDEETERKMVLFELDLPPWFAAWRDTTLRLLADTTTVIKYGVDNKRITMHQTLKDYIPLANHYTPRGSTVFCSRAKAAQTTHVPTVKIPCAEEEVIFPHMLKYKLYYAREGPETNAEGNWVTDYLHKSFGTRWKPQLFVYRLREPYKCLEFAMKTNHTTNQVLANQANASKDISLHEFYSFGSLRAGVGIQWLNIARELKTRLLTFSNEAVNTLFLQAAWEAGPTAGGLDLYRVAHRPLNRIDFSVKLLKDMELFVSHVEDNWMETITASTLIALTLRILVFSKNLDVEDVALPLLMRLRKVVYSWVINLKGQARLAESEEERGEIMQRILHANAVCRTSFDVNEEHLDVVFDSDGLAIYLECGALIYDNKLMTYENSYISILLDRDSRLSHRMEKEVRSRILADRTGIDIAIKRLWSDYKPGSPWEAMVEPNERWIQSKTRSSSTSPGHSVAFNILEGSLLINNVPLGRLPKSFTEHSTFKRLFGQSILSVGPSDDPRMKFQSSYKSHGYTVYFTLVQNQLIIRLKSYHEFLELIPLPALQGEIPQPLIHGFFHFLNLLTGMIELRPENSRWVASEHNWYIQLGNGNSPSKVTKGFNGIQLVNPQSGTAEMVNKIFSRLEHPSQILITTDRFGGDENSSLIIELPRMNLRFFNNAGNLCQCSTLQDMVIDSDQDCGTFVGLKDKLVLRQIDNTTQRTVIVPYGEITPKSETRHLRITVESAENANMRPYLTYQIDSDLGRLVDNGSLVSRLYQILLHAFTSSRTCRTDPLIGRSGAEEALYLLDCAATKSFHTLEDEEISLLKAIADISPRYERDDSNGEGQIIQWHKELPFTTQRGEFALRTRAVLEYWRRLRSLRPKQNLEEKEIDLEAIVKHGDEDLLSRAVITQARFYSAWSTESLDGKDLTYVGRDYQFDFEDDDGRPAKVYKVARMIYEWDCSKVQLKLLETLKQDSWKALNGARADFNLVQDRQFHETPLQEFWCSLYTALRRCRKEDCYRVMFCLSALAMRTPTISHEMICALVAIAIEDVFKNDNYALPRHSQFSLEYGFTITEAALSQKLKDKDFVVAFNDSEEAELEEETDGESEAEIRVRRRRTYNSNLRSQLEGIVEHYLQQWPTAAPKAPNSTAYHLFRIPKLQKKILSLFENTHKNLELSRVLERIQAILDGLQELQIPSPTFQFIRAANRAPSADTIATFQELFDDSERTPQLIPEAPAVLSLEDFPSSMESIEVSNERENELLEQLTADVRVNGYGVSRKYAEDLEKSVESLKFCNHPFDTISADLGNLEAYARACADHAGRVFEIIDDALSPQEPEHRAMASAGLWPKITTVSVITQLNHRNVKLVPEGWRRVFIEYGKALVHRNRADRLVQLAKSGQIQELMQELDNVGYRVFSAGDYPEWLLLEIANHMLIRDVQADIAKAMLSPPSGSNAVMQLNMGEGKSSVIVPMIASTIANSEQLARVVVLRPLLREMFNLLTTKLANICGRRIFHLPFSRNVEVYRSNVECIREIYEECIKERGILLVRPEDILSFKLIGLEKLCADDEQAKELIDLQKWLDEYSRDILDESDEILATKYQLIYTVGAQEPIEGNPGRWNIIEEVLGLAASKAREVLKIYPNGLEVVEKGSHVFPYLRVIDDNAGDKLLEMMAQAICKDSCLSSVTLDLQPISTKEATYKFITEHDADIYVFDIIKKNNDDDLWKGILLLRGLFAMGILKFVLKDKRYRVDYGHDFSRTRLAVPFKAKDVPGQADFAQPDVLLLLSCLSYYYSGLSEEEIIQCFQALNISDSPALEYENWIKGCQGVPDFLKELKGINIEDPRQRREHLIPTFKRNKSIIDFYLNTCVFPKEGKQFPEKLSTSGWDVAAAKANLTSGFSGTCDNRYLLPLSIKQLDMDKHTHTNALVLRYLLQQENNSFISLSKGEIRMATEQILDEIASGRPEISVLLDVGAQIVELNNIEVARLWLVKASERQAAVFFNEKHELSVIDREDRVELLMVSSYAKQLNKCLVYLDDAHTRGTDLKLPLSTRGVVTMGPGTNKDRLLQGCMRLRKLGHGQSVAFAAPSEIERAILESADKVHANDIETVDILRWSMLQSCKQTAHNLELWVAQGVDYIKRERAWTEFNRCYEETAEELEILRRDLLEKENKSLEDLYNVPNGSASSLSAKANAIVDPRVQEIIARCHDFGLDRIIDLQHEEEQEREVAQEIEVETEIERPAPAKAMVHVSHEDFRKFLSSGSIPKDSEYFIPAFDSLLETSIGDLVKKNAFTPRLLVTQDFANTVELRAQDVQDDFLRPVHFILSVKTKKRDFLVIASPKEIDDNLHNIRRNKKNIRLHLYSPKVTKTMLSFEDLKSSQVTHVVSNAWHASGSVMNQLNLFAGQLYFRSYKSYLNTAKFFGLHTPELDEKIDQVFTDGFVNPRKRILADGEKFKSPFNESPVPFLQRLLAMRRKGQRFNQSPVGKMVNGRLLQEHEFDDPDNETEVMDKDDSFSVDDSDSGNKNAMDIKDEPLSDVDAMDTMDVDESENEEAHEDAPHEDALGEEASSDIDMDEVEATHG